MIKHMKNSPKVWAWVVVVVVVAVAWAMFRDNSEVAQAKPLKIGVILPLTGDFEFFGGEIAKGTQIALEEAKAQGWDVQLITEDDQSKPTGSVNAANKLIHVDKVEAVVAAIHQQIQPMAPIFNQNKVPVLATWDSNNYIKTAGDYIFTIGFSTEDAGEKMATYAYEKLGLRRVAVISAQDDWSEIISTAYKNKFVSMGGQVVMDDKVQPNQKEFRTIITKAKNSNVDGVYSPLLPTTIAPFLSQAQQLGLKAKLMTADSFSMDEVEAAGSASEGVYFSNLYANDVRTLSGKYKSKFGSEPADPIFVSFGYDGVRTILEAAKKAQKDSVSIRDALTQVELQGTDAEIRMDGRQYFEKKEKLYKVQDSKFIEVR